MTCVVFVVHLIIFEVNIIWKQQHRDKQVLTLSYYISTANKFINSIYKRRKRVGIDYPYNILMVEAR